MRSLRGVNANFNLFSVFKVAKALEGKLSETLFERISDVKATIYN